MKIRLSQLRLIIKEEVSRALNEAEDASKFATIARKEKQVYDAYEYKRKVGETFDNALEYAMKMYFGNNSKEYKDLIGADGKPNKDFAEYWQSKYPDSELGKRPPVTFSSVKSPQASTRSRLPRDFGDEPGDLDEPQRYERSAFKYLRGRRY